ncbi:MAG: glycosyltransferase family 39 protein [Chloroflexota bacterium]
MNDAIATPAPKGAAPSRRGRLARSLVVAGLLAVFLALGSYYALTSPLYSRPDEPVHYAYTLHLLAGKGLPTVDTSVIGARNDKPTQMEAHQPPLYYAAVAAVARLLPAGRDEMPAMNPYFWTLPEDRRQLWLASFGVGPAEAPVFFAGRFLSLAAGALALLFAFRLARLFLPWGLAALTLAFMAFNPQFIFIASSFSNDMANTATATLGLWLLGVALRRGLNARLGLLLGLAIALAGLTKLSGFGLLAPLGVIALWQSWRRRETRPLAAALLAGLVVLALSGWWFWRNWELYGHPLALNLLNVLLGPAPGPLPLAKVEELLRWMAQSFWLDFGPAGFVFAEPLFYQALAALFALGVLGTALRLWRQPALAGLLGLVWGWFALVLASLLQTEVSSGIVMGGGRLMLPAAVAVALTLAVGLSELAGRRPLAVGVVALGLALFSTLAPARYVDPAYPKVALAANLERLPAYRSEARFGDGAVELLGFDLAQGRNATGQQEVTVTYYWRALRPLAKDLTVFIHLLGQEGSQSVGRAQFDSYPAYGAYPTSWWQADRIVVDRLSLALPESNKPADGQIMTGLYDKPSGARLRATDSSGRELPSFAVNLAQVRTTATGERQVLVQGEPLPPAAR